MYARDMYLDCMHYREFHTILRALQNERVSIHPSMFCLSTVVFEIMKMKIIAVYYCVNGEFRYINHQI